MPPLKDEKLKIEYVSLKISKLLSRILWIVKQGNFLNAHFFDFLNAFPP